MIPSPFPGSSGAFPSGLECAPALSRLIENLSGFVYRRRHDATWTMEFVSDGCRDLTGYDPHRFIANESVAFADLIAPADRARVNALVRSAVRHRSRATIDYFIRAAHGLWLNVEDRFTPVFDAAGRLRAIEGVIDRARCQTRAAVTLHNSAENHADAARSRTAHSIPDRS